MKEKIAIVIAMLLLSSLLTIANATFEEQPVPSAISCTLEHRTPRRHFGNLSVCGVSPFDGVYRYYTGVYFDMFNEGMEAAWTITENTVKAGFVAFYVSIGEAINNFVALGAFQNTSGHYIYCDGLIDGQHYYRWDLYKASVGDTYVFTIQHIAYGNFKLAINSTYFAVWIGPVFKEWINAALGESVWTENSLTGRFTEVKQKLGETWETLDNRFDVHTIGVDMLYYTKIEVPYSCFMLLCGCTHNGGAWPALIT